MLVYGFYCRAFRVFCQYVLQTVFCTLHCVLWWRAVCFGCCRCRFLPSCRSQSCFVFGGFCRFCFWRFFWSVSRVAVQDGIFVSGAGFYVVGFCFCVGLLFVLCLSVCSVLVFVGVLFFGFCVALHQLCPTVTVAKTYFFMQVLAFCCCCYKMGGFSAFSTGGLPCLALKLSSGLITLSLVPSSFRFSGCARLNVLPSGVL